MAHPRLPKRRPSAHQRQIRFFLFFFLTLIVVALVGLMLLLNKSPRGI